MRARHPVISLNENLMMMMIDAKFGPK